MGESRAPSSAGAGVWLKSALKASVLFAGGAAGRAAIAGQNGGCSRVHGRLFVVVGLPCAAGPAGALHRQPQRHTTIPL